MFMFRHQGRVRVALSEQDAEGGDRLFDNALAAGAEDFDQVPGADGGVEVEVRSVSLLSIHCHLMIHICLDGL